MTVKYATRSAARKSARNAGFDMDTLDFYPTDDGKYAYRVKPEFLTDDDVAALPAEAASAQAAPVPGWDVVDTSVTQTTPVPLYDLPAPMYDMPAPLPAPSTALMVVPQPTARVILAVEVTLADVNTARATAQAQANRMGAPFSIRDASTGEVLETVAPNGKPAKADRPAKAPRAPKAPKPESAWMAARRAAVQALLRPEGATQWQVSEAGGWTTLCKPEWIAGMAKAFNCAMRVDGKTYYFTADNDAAQMANAAD